MLKPDLKLAVDGQAEGAARPALFTPAKGATLTLDGKGYRGELRATAIAKGLQIVDTVALDQYILGVVPGEMPKEWPAAALQAQAVAARSYALASIVKNRDFDLYADPRSQMYYGVAAESPATTAAVKATKGEILTYGGKVATTFYYSSSGGRTASSEDVFGLALPYLQSRPDPVGHAARPTTAGRRARSPPTTLAAAFGLSAPVVDVDRRADRVGTPGVRDPGQEDRREDPAQGGRRPRAARVSARPRSSSACSASAARRPPRPAGKPVVVSGLARDVQAPLLQKLAANGTWVPSIKVAPDGDGSFAVTVRPKITATYRLTADGQVGPGADDHRPRGTGEVIARAAALVAAVVLSLAGTATAQAARFAVGIAPTADRAELRAQLEARGATRDRRPRPDRRPRGHRRAARATLRGAARRALRRGARSRRAVVRPERPAPAAAVVRRPEPVVRRVDRAAAARGRAGLP